MRTPLPTHRGTLLVILGLVEQELVIRIHGSSGAGDARAFSPWLECDRRNEIDEACRELAARLGQPTVKPAYCIGLRKLERSNTELVLQRVRDSQRWLRETREWIPTAERTREEHFCELLIDGWHTYAEPYWQERLQAHSAAAVNSSL